MIEEDKQYWNFKDDITPDEEGEMLRWKYSYPCTRELFEWLPWGKPGCFREIQASTAQLAESDETEVQTLGEPQVSLVDTSPAINVINTLVMLRSTDNKSVILIVEERVDSDEPDSTVFWGNMGNGSRCGNFCGSLKGNGAGRGAPPPTAPPPMIPLGWGQPPWMGMPYYPPYMALPAPPTQGMYFPGEYHKETSNVPDDFHPPSPPKGLRAEAPKTGQKRHHFETEQEDLRHEVRKEKAPPSHYEQRKAPVDRVK